MTQVGSVYGEGTTVTIRLPLQKRETEPVETKEEGENE